MTISNKFFPGTRVSNALFIGIIQAGTASWHFIISIFACILYCAANFPVPLPIFLINSFQFIKDCLKLKSFSVFLKRWNQELYSHNSAVVNLSFLLNSRFCFCNSSKGSFNNSNKHCSNCFHFHASDTVLGTVVDFPISSILFLIESAQVGAYFCNFAKSSSLVFLISYFEYNSTNSL